jgi:hypothetical protein
VERTVRSKSEVPEVVASKTEILIVIGDNGGVADGASVLTSRMPLLPTEAAPMVGMLALLVGGVAFQAQRAYKVLDWGVASGGRTDTEVVGGEGERLGT